MKGAVTGTESLGEAVRLLRQPQQGPDVRHLLLLLTQTFIQQARLFAPMRSGQLRDSIDAQITADGITITALAPYAINILQGVTPHYMTWLLGKTVTFIARDGRRVTRRVTFVGMRNGVRHWWNPGQAPNDFFKLAWESGAVQRVLQQLRDAGIDLGIAFLY